MARPVRDRFFYRLLKIRTPVSKTQNLVGGAIADFRDGGELRQPAVV